MSVETPVPEGRLVFERTSVLLEGMPVALEGTTLGVEESALVVPVDVAERQSVDIDKSVTRDAKPLTRRSRGG